MAQNIAGIGRRSLVPLLCDYCKLNNIGSNFYASTLGGDKELMYTLIAPYVSSNIPYTVHETKLLIWSKLWKESKVEHIYLSRTMNQQVLASKRLIFRKKILQIF